MLFRSATALRASSLAEAPPTALARSPVRRFRQRGLALGLTLMGTSLAAIAVPRARYDMVRTGIAIYGLSAGHGVGHVQQSLRLRPALSLHARVSHVQRLAAGERISYGLRHEFIETNEFDNPDYVKNNPNQPYVQACSLPKVYKVREAFKDWLKEEK